MTAREHPSLPFVFRLIEDAAVRGVRCPSNDEIAQAMYRAGKRRGWQQPYALFGRLVKSGQIRLTQHGVGRVVVILVGSHAGKMTASGAQASPWSIEDLERRRQELQTW